MPITTQSASNDQIFGQAPLFAHNRPILSVQEREEVERMKESDTISKKTFD
ncbi:hypothetical protein [Coxiella-like endosymbiont]|uniref:hypothetical protein n=1 Tax=Coxiella-like endosymbiont TaxID=1592897 RepID=UPI00272C82CF|nr:hypothetical protein [Coxiella-like endosymbiont]